MLWRAPFQPLWRVQPRFASDTLPLVGAGSPMRDGDEDTFAAQVTPHTAALLRVAATLVGVTEAEDAAQEALMRAWQAWPQLRDRAAVRSWLLRITVNVCQQWLRGDLGKRKRLTLPLLPESVEWIPALGGDPGDSDHANALDLRRALALLPAALRIVVTLRYYGGMTTQEIGEALGMPTRTVQGRLQSALERLRQHLHSAPQTQEEDFHG